MIAKIKKSREKKPLFKKSWMKSIQDAIACGDVQFVSENRRRCLEPSAAGPFLYPGDAGYDAAIYEEELIFQPEFVVKRRAFMWENPAQDSPNAPLQP